MNKLEVEVTETSVQVIRMEIDFDSEEEYRRQCKNHEVQLSQSTNLDSTLFSYPTTLHKLFFFQP